MQPLRLQVAAAALAGASLLLAPSGGRSEARNELTTTALRVPAPQPVYARSAPLRQDRTALVPFDTAPFPYDGPIASSDEPFLNVEEYGRRGHKTPFGRLYWEDETYNDQRVLLHIPKGFDVRKPSVMIVYFHGHGATLRRDVVRRQRVPAQITASGVNAVLVAPQLAVNAADSSAGKFWEPGAFARFVGEAAQQLARLHGDPRSLRTFASMPIVLVAYSGGYQAAAWCASKGGLAARVRGVILLDALYGEVDRFASFIARDRSAFFVSTYLSSTESKNAELERVLADNAVAFDTALEPRLEPGSVTIFPGATGSTDKVSHRDLVTRAWVDYPVADLLRRLRQYRR
ncbi:MAG TPA: alpha/beta hydrolase [Hyphomicrobium sp.]|jgi:hypothetical protein